ncbi:MAG: hypothetical protein WCI60_00255 [bacterium]
MNIKRTNKLKTNSSGFGHIEMLLIVVAVVVIGGVGFFVYQNQNKKTAKAHAGSWASYPVYSQVCTNWTGASNCPGGQGTFGGRINSTFWACRQYINIYGGINQLHAHFNSVPYFYNGINRGTYIGPYGIIPDNQTRQDGKAWSVYSQNGMNYANSKDFTINFPSFQWHNFYAVLNDGSQQVNINVNYLPQC